MSPQSRRAVGPVVWLLASVVSLSAVALAALTAKTHAADVPTASPAKLNLPNGDTIQGDLVDSSDLNVLRWHGKHFAMPFEFSASRISSIHFPLPTVPAKPIGEYCFELSGDDVVFGSLLGLNNEVLDVDSPKLGHIHLPRASVRRFYRWQDSDLIYLGPNGLTGWGLITPEKPWIEDSGQPVATSEGAIIRGDFGLPAQSVIEFEVSWKNKPDFAFAVGVSGDDVVARQAFRFEIWIDDLIVQRELPETADVAALQGIQSGSGRAHFIAYLDQMKGRMLVFAPNGQLLSDLKVPDKKPQAHSGLMIENKRGDLRLERLRISRWNGVVPLDVQANKARLHKTDGSIVYGQIAGYDRAKKEFLVRDGNVEVRLSGEQLSTVLVSPPDAVPPRSVRVVCHDGTQISGSLVKLQEGVLHLTTPGVQEPIKIARAEVRSIIGLKREALPTPPENRRLGTLALDGTLLKGVLLDGVESKTASCLVWQPAACASASSLKHGVAGTITYRTQAPKTETATGNQQQLQQVGPRLGIGGALLSILGPSSSRPAVAKGHTLHLMSGDTVPCTVTKIDENGLTIQSSVAAATLIPHSKVKALELINGQPPRLGKVKRERLLMLPRLLKDQPPTHILRSINGDYLRGHLISFSPEKVRMDVRLESKEIESSKIAQVIWLHREELGLSPESPANGASSDNKQPEATEAAKPPMDRKAVSEQTRIQALKRDGTRLTFSPEKLTGKLLEGRSDVLGTCRAEISEVDQFIIGDQIEKAASELLYHQWKLTPPTEPRFVNAANDPDSDGSMTGTESPLVGKPAPSFELDMLDGKRFKVGDYKGKVLVLDFWASWCGPCLQAMPDIHRVVSGFEGQPVALIGVNLEEPASTVKATLERHKLKLTVAMDQDGAAALKYGATSIPQTVVIDPQGVVTRVFVGGGPSLPDALKTGIEAALSKDAKKPQTTPMPNDALKK